MKKIILLLLLATSVISCSKDDDDNGGSDKEASLIGKWSLISDLINSEERITPCQYEYFQLEFKSGYKFVAQMPTDDPDAELTECEPILHYSNYEVIDDRIWFPDIEMGPTDYVYLDAITESSLVLRYAAGGDLNYRIMTYKKVK